MTRKQPEKLHLDCEGALKWAEANVSSQLGLMAVRNYIMMHCFEMGDRDYNRVRKGILEQMYLTRDQFAQLDKVLLGKRIPDEAEEEGPSKDKDNVHMLPVKNQSNDPPPLQPNMEIQSA